jgi:hypothetical protein
VAAAAAVAAGRRQRESTVTQRHGRGLHLSVVVPLVRGGKNKFKLQTLKVFKLQTFWAQSKLLERLETESSKTHYSHISS